MAKAKMLSYAHLPWSPRLCAVDDAWFEGGKAGFVVFDRLGLGGLHKKTAPLKALQTALVSKSPTVSGDADARYLRLLVEVCLTHQFTLSLCNFEGLDAFWPQLNLRQTAILLDLNYTLCPPNEIAENYGLRSMHRLLDGNRPHAEVFVVTGGPEAYSRLVDQHADEASWWPIRAFPVLAKLPQADLERDMKCFAQYFKQGNLESPLTSLLRTLVRAKLDQWVWSHPHSFEADIPKDLSLLALYASNEMVIKALYHHYQSNSQNADYYVPVSVLAALLSTSGFRIESGSGNIWLPWAPFGILWVAQVWHFLNLLSKENTSQRCGGITVNSNWVTLVLPLDKPSFLEAWEGRIKRGTTTRALHDVQNRSGHDEVFHFVGDKERCILREFVVQVKVKPLPPDYWVTVDNNSVRIAWKNA